jgi:hypothetical protein
MINTLSQANRRSKMAVREIPTEEKEKLRLEIDNGELYSIKEVIKKWNFKDIQSFLRFSISLLLKTERTLLYIDVNGSPEGRIPAKHLLKESNSVESAKHLSIETHEPKEMSAAREYMPPTPKTSESRGINNA